MVSPAVEIVNTPNTKATGLPSASTGISASSPSSRLTQVNVSIFHFVYSFPFSLNIVLFIVLLLSFLRFNFFFVAFETYTQTVSIRDHEELAMKLKILETKRADDREKLKEMERLRAELEQGSLAKQKLVNSLKQAQKENTDLKAILKNGESVKNKLESKYAEAMEQLEMITLDKEVAEEKVEALQVEIDKLREKLEELELDNEVLKQENGSLILFFLN